jgi:cytochrome c oxidase subunit 2
MTSQRVLHSFFIPAFRVKQDVLPNRYTSVWFEATKKGSYDLFCSEYCGVNHSEMGVTVEVMPRDQFDEWLEEAGTPKDIPLPELGKQLYANQGCQGCHSLDGSAGVGPSWKGLYGSTDHEMSDGSTVTADENYLRQSILKPGAKIVQGYGNNMVSYAHLSDRQISGLIEFIKEQSDKTPPEN